jgi:hypothetical protein
MQNYPSNLANNTISPTTTKTFTIQMPQEISFGIKNTFTGTTTTKTLLNTFLHSYRYPKN